MAFGFGRRKSSALSRIQMATLLREHLGSLSFGEAEMTLREVGGPGGALLGLLSPRRMFARGTRMPARIVEAYVQSPWVRAVVGKIAEGIASTQWTLQRGKERTDVGRAFEVARRMNRSATQVARKRLAKAAKMEEVLVHPALDLLEAGNPHFPGPTVAELSQVYLELAGEALLVKERDPNGNPIALYPVPPAWCVRRPLPTDRLPMFTFRLNGVESQLPASEVVWIAQPNPSDPYFQMAGIGSALGDEIDVDDMAAKLERQMFLTGGIKPTIVHAEGLSESGVRRLQEDMEQQTRGFWRAFRLYFIDKKLEFETIGSTARDLQLEKLRAFERDVIVHTFGMPPEMLGILESSNRATITAAAYLFARWLLVPRLERRRAVLQAQLVADFGDPALVLDYVSPIEEDMQAKLAAMQAASWAFTQDEWRGVAGFSDVEAEKGKVYAVPFTLRFQRELVPVEDMPEPELPEPEPIPGGDDQDDDEPEKALPEFRPEMLRQRHFHARLPGSNAKADEDEREIDAEKLAAILAAAAGALAWKALHDHLRAMLGATADHFGAIAATENGGSWNPETERMRDWRANGYVPVLRAVNENTVDEVRRTVRAALEERPTWAAARSAASAVLERAAETRAPVLGTSTSVTAAGFGSEEGMRQAAVPLKDWVSERDDRVRDTHVALDQADPIPLEQDFESPSGARGPHPGALGVPEEDAGCRCVLAAAYTDAQGAPQRVYDTPDKREAAWKRMDSERLAFEAQGTEAARAAFREQKSAVLAAIERVRQGG